MRNEVWQVTYWIDATLERASKTVSFPGPESQRKALNFAMALPAHARVQLEMTGDALGG